MRHLAQDSSVGKLLSPTHHCRQAHTSAEVITGISVSGHLHPLTHPHHSQFSPHTRGSRHNVPSPVNTAVFAVTPPANSPISSPDTNTACTTCETINRMGRG